MHDNIIMLSFYFVLVSSPICKKTHCILLLESQPQKCKTHILTCHMRSPHSYYLSYISLPWLTIRCITTLHVSITSYYIVSPLIFDVNCGNKQISFLISSSFFWFIVAYVILSTCAMLLLLLPSSQINLS